MVTSKYFKEAEFQRCSPACSLQDMKQDFMTLLDRVREMAGIPLVLNSAYRSVDHERKMGRDGKSAHTLGCAADIRCQSDSSRYAIINAAIYLGFKRIGIEGKFLHLDCSEKHSQRVAWMY